MATIDYTIPGQIKSVQIEPPMNAMARAMELRGLQEASNLNAMKMQEYARARQEENALRQLFASGLKPDSDEFRNRLYSDAPGLAPNIEKGLLERSKASAEIDFKKAQQKKEAAEALSKKLTLHREIFNPFAVTTPDEAGAHAAAFYDDPDFSPYANKMMSREVAIQKSKDLFRTNKPAWLMSQVKLSGDKILEATDRRDNESYSAYVNAELAAGRYPLAKDKFLQLNASQVAPEVDAAGVVAPVSETVTETVTEQPQPAPTAADGKVLPNVDVTGKKDGMQGLHPYAEALYGTGLAADKAKADKIQAAYVEDQKNKRLTGDFLGAYNAQKEIFELEKNPTPENKRLIDVLRGQIKAAEKGRATTLSVGLSTEKKYGEQFAGNVAKADVDLKDAAERAPEAANTANRILELLQSGQVITGSAANIKLQMSKFLRLGGGSESEAITNTEVLLSSLADSTLGAIKSSGLGSGQGFTNSDRDFLERAKAGQITYEAASLKRLAKLAHTAAAATAGKWNKRSKTIPKSALEGTGISTENIEVSPLYKSGGGSKTPPTNAQGWKLEVDRNGNRAYVSPDRKQFEEVK
jgi:hypothetical protein